MKFGLLLALFAASGFAAVQAHQPATRPPTAQQRRRQAEQPNNKYRRTSGGKRYSGLGWSVAQDRRMAKKRRNQLRHRKACKGR